ncbi:REP-associated tyrosine transposase [Paludisphaera soli]|uniref:REP-associated tyrosine transposase n=1 Tax=Paludisphaera soli TaxID=2712865 RepID=UPI001981643B|nr:hypothetical protein [Paludisphaera soli]
MSHSQSGDPPDGGPPAPPGPDRRIRPIDSRLLRTRRTLPHWQLGGSTYFLTYRCAPGRALDEADRSLVLGNWRHWDRRRYLLHAIVVMPDHVHVLTTPVRREDGTFYSLAEILHTNKGFSARAINRLHATSGPVWQDERYDRIMRDEPEFWETWVYMNNNPVEAGLCPTPEDYPWWYGDAQGFEEGFSPARPGGPPGPPDS